MPRYAAFLRAVNVGGRTIVMADLRAAVTSLGFTNVETFIASGNVIFDARGTADSIERKIETGLAKAFGFEIPVLLRTIEEVAVAATRETFPAAELATATSFNVAFTKPALDAEARSALSRFETGVDRFQIHGGELYWLSLVKQAESKFSNTALEKATGVRSTIRTLNTVRKIAEKYAR